jgi:hypothetical protein
MGRRCKLDGFEVRAVIGDELPDYEFEVLQELIKKVARRKAARMEREAQEDLCLTA